VKTCLYISLLLWGVSTGGQQTPVTTGVDALRKAHPDVKWNSNTAVVADVTCDGSTDTVILGSQKTKVWVAVVSGKQHRNDQIFSFPIGSDKQNGFCSVPTRIEIRPLDCKSDQGTLPGCKPIESCREFTVIDNDCDPFNFYWDSSRKSLAWWRN